jgi:hypothetical protein
LKVRDKDLDRDTSVILTDRSDGLGELEGTAVGKVVSGHGRNDYIPQTQSIHRLHNMVGLLRVGSLGLAMLHRTKGAIAIANTTQYHERGCAFGKAFCPIGTTGTFTDGVQLQVTGELCRPVEYRRLKSA